MERVCDDESYERDEEIEDGEVERPRARKSKIQICSAED